MRGAAIALLLAGAAGGAGAQYEIADLSDAEITRICAEHITKLGDARKILGSIGMEATGTGLTKLDIENHKRCVADIELERLLQRGRRVLDAQAIENARIYGTLLPGEGYHIVWLPRGRIEHSPRAAIYVRGRAYAPPPTVDAAKP